MEMKIVVLVFLSLVWIAGGYFRDEEERRESCFCQLKGHIGDCGCNVESVDHFNNLKIYPRLRSLLPMNYFKFYKVNLNKACPFWNDDSRCAIRHCHVEHCSEATIPVGLKGQHAEDGEIEIEEATQKYRSDNQDIDCDSDHDLELSSIDTTISDETVINFARWKKHDDATDFCVTDDDDDDIQYVDLLLNPERFTGYRGKSAHRIWNSIYKENCFRPSNSGYDNAYIETANLARMCLEKRVFYRVISGMHSSINIHLCAKYALGGKSTIGIGGRWGPNYAEFHRRFHPDTTNGEGPHWLKNLYFLYLLELRALAKAAPYLSQETYFTGNVGEDEEVREAVKDLLEVIQSFPASFNEHVMFTGSRHAYAMKREFRLHFRNISRIMDCVGCEKCKLWGKLQIHGLGTALKILFSGQFEDTDETPLEDASVLRSFRLDRNEIVALLNAFGRLSDSIYELENFREKTR